MTQIDYSFDIIRVRRSIRAVFPEPTGPPTPIITYDIRVPPQLIKCIVQQKITYFYDTTTYIALSINIHDSYNESHMRSLKCQADQV